MTSSFANSLDKISIKSSDTRNLYVTFDLPIYDGIEKVGKIRFSPLTSRVMASQLETKNLKKLFDSLPRYKFEFSTISGLGIRR